MHTLSVAAAACPSRRAPCRHRAASRTCVRATRKVTQHTTGGDCDIAVHIYGTAEEVAAALCARVEAEARDAVAKRGVFALAVPGGSVLKMLAGLTDSSMDWSKARESQRMRPQVAMDCADSRRVQVVLAYANHKCVPLDAETSTHAKALKLFLGAATRAGCVVITPGGSDDAPAEAAKYNARLLGETRISKEPGTGVCQFDLCLLGMGSDGADSAPALTHPAMLTRSLRTRGLAVPQPPRGAVTKPAAVFERGQGQRAELHHALIGSDERGQVHAAGHDRRKQSRCGAAVFGGQATRGGFSGADGSV